MKKNSWIAYLGGAALLVALAWWAHGRPFSVGRLSRSVAVFGLAAIAIAATLVAYVLDCGPCAGPSCSNRRKSGLVSLLGSQVIGFTAVALFGRLADLVRPYLVSRRTKLPLASQIAVYTVERMFDLAAMALIFSSALLLAPDRATLPHHEAFQRSALVGLVAIASAIFAIAVRASGNVMPAGEKWLGALSPNLGHSRGTRFSPSGMALTLFKAGRLSLFPGNFACHVGNDHSRFLETMRAFVLSPQLSTMTLARCMVLMAASMAGSVVHFR